MRYLRRFRKYILLIQGAQTFLVSEYIYLTIFVLIFGVAILVTTDNYRFYTVIAYLIGAITSTVSGYIGMYIATRANVRVTYQAATGRDEKEALRNAFNVAFQGGCVMGFFLVSLALAILTFIIMVYISLFEPTQDTYIVMFEYIAGYGLGGSTVALFCRVGGGIYTKAADVGADLVGKLELGLDEDSPKNPATIADNVGDNVGDIAGMGSDLFGSLAESTCAALVIGGSSTELKTGSTFMYPLILSAAGILVCIVTAFFATHIMKVSEKKDIERTLKYQLIISTILLTPSIILISIYCLPEDITFVNGNSRLESKSWMIMVSGLLGLWSGLLIGYFTDYMTSNAHLPVKDLAIACKSGPAINIIHGLALGYLSTLVPILAITGNYI
jgi:H(+)-translocating pyrophosphatase